MANKDLRAWIDEIEAAGELTRISGAEREKEIGGIVDLLMRKMTNPAVLFDAVPGFDANYRVLANILCSTPRVNLAVGLPAEAPPIDLVQYWRRYMADPPLVAPKPVNGGPVLENLAEGEAVNLEKFPTPRWHELDGGYYIGTAAMVVMKDPDSDWINCGIYRVQSHDARTASVMISSGKQGGMILKKYHERGEPCPVAVVAGMHPAFFMIAGTEMPHGKSEFEYAGGILGEAIEVINGPTTGLPIPADAEIAFEGLIHPGDTVLEGPLGEWTGYYAGGANQEPAIRVTTLMHRNDPILVGAIPAVPPNDNTFFRGFSRSGMVWSQLEAAGIPEVKGVWTHEAGGGRMWLTVAIRQMYPGHSKQAGFIASQCHAGAYANRWVIVVDDDIDPANMNDVVWAMCTRCDPREGVDVLNGCWSTRLDPMAYGEDDPRNSRVVVDACIPYRRKASFPVMARSSPELDAEIRAKWGKDLPPGA
ncbi:MAG: UbiD family decarboxylase [Alphaproteobacteria bacterium]|nr:UbiD family decarboxylase [Alphaproteobacteria bacterium]